MVSLTLALLLAGCVAPLFVESPRRGPWADGVYEASYSHGLNSARVRVTVGARRIVAVQVVHHGGSFIGARAVGVIPRRIVAAQTTNVDAVSGASNSSRVIMNAAYLALMKARARAAAPP
jgi:uncharacterized protein with FMN-binding domain